MIEIGVDPVAFTIGTISVRWYGIFISLAIVWLVGWMTWQVKKGARVSYDTIITAALVGIPSGIIISKVLHVIDNIVVAKLHPELALIGHVIDYTQHPEQIFSGGGQTAYGAILGASLGIWIFFSVRKMNYGYFFDLLAPAVAVAQAVIGRIGCTLNGCCGGIEASTWLPWSVVYTHENHQFTLGDLFNKAIHPIQVYEIIFALMVFGVLVKLRGRFKPDGSLFLIYLGLYAVWRLGIDFLRVGNPFLFDLHQAQVISIIVLAIVVSVLVMKTRWVKAGEQEQLESNEGVQE